MPYHGINYTSIPPLERIAVELASVSNCGMITPIMWPSYRSTSHGIRHLLAGIAFLLLSASCTQTPATLARVEEAARLSPPTQRPTITKGPTLQVSPTTMAPPPTTTLTRTPRPTETATAIAPLIIRIGPDDFPFYVNPLTGLVPSNPLNLDRRPIAVKIPNAPHSVHDRQFGLSLADHIFEYHLEWGLTRFVGIFYGNDAVKIGPIRSGRIFDAQIMDMYNAILVFNGADQRVIDYFKEIEQDFDLFVVERQCPPTCRDENFSPPNNLYSNTTLIHDYIRGHGTDDSRPDLASNYFYSLGAPSWNGIQRIYIYYSYASYAYWAFDSQQNRYIRYQGSVDLIGEQEEVFEILYDRLTEEPITVDNVVVLFASHKFFHHSSDTEVFSIDLTGRGEAYIFRNGKAYEAIWERRETYKPLSLLNPDGTPFPLKPGVTFFQIVHTTSTITKEDHDWTFTFVRPDE